MKIQSKNLKGEIPNFRESTRCHEYINRKKEKKKKTETAVLQILQFWWKCLNSFSSFNASIAVDTFVRSSIIKTNDRRAILIQTIVQTIENIDIDGRRDRESGDRRR